MGYNGTTGAPNAKGFDYYYGQLDQAYCHNMYPRYLWENTEQVMFPNNEGASRERCMASGNTCSFSHDLFTNKTLQVLQERAQHRDQPFFLMVTYTDPHAGGWEGDKEQGNPVPSDGSFIGTYIACLQLSTSSHHPCCTVQRA